MERGNTTSEADEPRQLVHGLYRLSLDDELDIDGRIHGMLELGCQKFDLPWGILARIRGSRYDLRWLVEGKSLGLRSQTHFLLSETFCSQTIMANEPIQYSLEEGDDPPRHLKGALGTYLGCPVVVNGHVYGTLHFFDRKAKAEAFSKSAFGAIRFMAVWVGAELSRHAYSSNLQSITDRYYQNTCVDEETGVLNLRGLNDVLTRLNRSFQSDTDFQCCVIDVYLRQDGHISPTRALIQSVGEWLKDGLPSDVSLGRANGAEFVGLWSQCSKVDALQHMEQLIAAMLSTGTFRQLAGENTLVQLTVLPLEPGQKSIVMVLRDGRLSSETSRVFRC